MPSQFYETSFMGQSKEIIIKEANNFLLTLLEGEDASIIPQITPIVLQNIKIGRFNHYSKSGLGISNYINLVIQNYKENQKKIDEIQKEKSDTTWEPLFQNVLNSAFMFFLGKNFFPDSETRDIAEDCAVDASMVLVNARFPYDCEIDPWIYVIVRRSCLKYIRNLYCKSKIPENQISSINYFDISNENIPDNTFSLETYSNNIVNKAIIEKYIHALSDTQQKVINMIYFDNLSVASVARELNKSTNSIYLLQLRAVDQLRKLLAKNESSFDL